MNRDIDFVVTWVDGNDPVWQKKKSHYETRKFSDDRPIRYRDWGLLRYWFRAVEAYAPWVHHVYLVSDHQCPAWLNRNAWGLTVVDHTDYLPLKFLPVFNANAIEMNLHRIQGLSEQFVFFNDDMFLTAPTRPEDFFRNGLPCDSAVLSPVMPNWNEEICRIVQNDMILINKHFVKKLCIKENRSKWFSLHYGKQLMRTLCLMPWHHFPGFFNDHLPQALLKSTYEEVWAAESEILNEVTTHRFRDYASDVNQWLLRYWQLCKGNFCPVSPQRGRDMDIEAPETLEAIRKKQFKMICINDKAGIQDYQSTQQAVQEAFETVLPMKSRYENDG